MVFMEINEINEIKEIKEKHIAKLPNFSNLTKKANG